MATLSFDEFLNFFIYFKGEKQQIDGAHILYDQMRDVLKDDRHRWVKTYRNKSEVAVSNPLPVPYQSQNDNASGTGHRECFSSSCAMVAIYYGKVKNDDEYNLIRESFGDTTNRQVQVATLRSLGLEAEFIKTGTTADLKAMIDEGRPVVCGWLHKGSVSSPTGGGHYSVVIGYTDDAWIVHDPNGEAALVSGGYTDNFNGKGLLYSFKNWNPRWIVAGEGDGYYMNVEDPSAKKVTAGVQETEPTRTSQDGIDLIKSFEGLRLESYYCSSNVLTIGYGHTNGVYEGQVITEQDAEELLRKDLMWFEQEVSRLILPKLTQHEFDAIVSFAFNVGSGALSDSTFCRRMNAGENKAKCFREEFPKWVNGPNGPLPGLVRRRDAEVELATSGI